jgi:phage recombination protein Bet
MNAVALHEPQELSVIGAMASRFGMDKRAFEATLRATIMPKDCSSEQVAAFLLVAKQHELNPFTKEIFAFPSRGGIQPIVSVDGWMKLINSHPQFNGMEFYDHWTEDESKLFSITCKIFRKDRGHAIEVTEYMSECYRDTETWKRWPARMLRHKAAIQAARYAFGFAGIMEPDEVERMVEVEQVERKELTQDDRDEQKRIACKAATDANAEAVKTIKDCIAAADDEQDAAKQREWLLQVSSAWYALPNETQIALYSCAPTKGGIFTTHERDVIHNKLPRGEVAQA